MPDDDSSSRSASPDSNAKKMRSQTDSQNGLSEQEAEGAFENFRIAQKTIDKLQGKTLSMLSYSVSAKYVGLSDKSSKNRFGPVKIGIGPVKK